jgi:hypothetical protein
MFYKYLDLPKLPSELEMLCLDLSKLEPNVRWREPTNCNNIQIDTPVQYNQYLAPKEVLRWIASNHLIFPRIRVARVHVMHSGLRTHPHMDFPRTIAVNYILTESTATTCFYEHIQNPNIIPTKNNEIFSLDEIKLVDSVVLDHHRWHQLDVTKIHSVENITIPRIALTLSDK